MAESYYWQQYHHGNLEVKVEKSNGKEENGVDKSNTKGKEIILKVYMHCEGCALKVFNYLKAFEGVEEVKTEWKGNRVIVKGEKADPLKVLERVKKKYSRNVELLYPKPKANEKKVPVPQKKQETPIKVVVLKMYMHCDGCANDIKKSIQRMKGILKAEPDRTKSTVTIRGNFNPPKLVETITKQLGKHVEIVGGAPNEQGNAEGNNKHKEEDILFHYPHQHSQQHIYPTQIFSDENIFSCSIM